MNSTPRLAAVVFDLDGVIVNSEDVYEQADVEVLRRRGKTYDPILRERMMGRPTHESLQIMIEYHALADPLEQVLHERTTLRDKLLETTLAPMPGLLPLLDSITAAGLPVAVATSATPEYAA